MDLYLFGGLISLTPQNQPVIPPSEKHTGYQVRTSYGLANALISILTIGIIHTRTKKVLVYTDQSRNDVLRKSPAK